MSHAIIDGLALVDATGRLILCTNLACLLAAILAVVALRARYADLERDLRENEGAGGAFSHPVLGRIAREAREAAARSREVPLQAIVEEGFQAELKPLLLAERFVRAATGLVIILGLLGTFYGLTLSVGRLVHLVSANASAVSDVTQAVTGGLTRALTGMAVAFSNSLLGVASAVVLTVLGVFFNVTDRRVALMVQIETYLDRMLAGAGLARRPDPGVLAPLGPFGESVAKLERSVARFDDALRLLVDRTDNLTAFQVNIVASKRSEGR